MAQAFSVKDDVFYGLLPSFVGFTFEDFSGDLYIRFYPESVSSFLPNKNGCFDFIETSQ